MMNAEGDVLYVGKARNLKKRVSSYFHSKQSLKNTSLVQQIHQIETIVTHTENEALLLESNLIKKFKPRYNILLRDDKGYPYIVLTDHPDFPRLEFYRGVKRSKNRYFGPYPSSTAVRETLQFLQKLFRIRSCTDSFFRARTRPCLQYQIKRCTAPCVGYIDPEHYQLEVRRAVLFLEGKDQEIIADLIQQMETAAQNLEFETAAYLRDQIAMLRQIHQQQAVDAGEGDVDIIAVELLRAQACVQMMSVRKGRLLGSRSYFPTLPSAMSAEEILSAFVPQYYLQATSLHEIPKQILLSHTLEEQNWIAQALSEQAKRQIQLINNPRTERARWLQLALQNAKQALSAHLASRATAYQRMEALQTLLQLEVLPERLECFDISHSQGEATVASCVVFDENGARKMDYRRFNIEGITPGDDYAAMQQALSRRYTHVKTTEGRLPDVLIIDGGKGQLAQAEQVLEELQITGVTILGVAKGPGRKAGLETLFLSGESVPLQTTPDSLALHLVQEIRDEAHRFAITGHRGRRAKKRNTSTLESIPGIGATRRRELLKQFGGLQELKRASIEELAKVPGVSKALATKIYEALQG